MNEYAIIFWISFILIFIGHFLFLRLEKEKLGIIQFIVILCLNYLIYMSIDYCAVQFGPSLIGTHISQTIIGLTAGWFVSRNLKNTFRLTNYGFVSALILSIGWYNHIF
jgi:hypothetical protein